MRTSTILLCALAGSVEGMASLNPPELHPLFASVPTTPVKPTPVKPDQDDDGIDLSGRSGASATLKAWPLNTAQYAKANKGWPSTKGVAVDGDYFVLGAWTEDAYTGAAYVHKTSDGTLVATLKAAPNPAETSPPLHWSYAGRRFGKDVSISGTTVVVGASGSRGGAKAYVFFLTPAALNQCDTPCNLTESFKLEPPKELEFNPYSQYGTAYFGESVSILGESVLVGAPSANEHKGGVYVYCASTGKLLKSIAPPADITGTGNFGRSVAQSRDTFLIGAPQAPTAIYSTKAYGAAYEFETTGTLRRTLKASRPYDTLDRNMFGWSVAIDATGVSNIRVIGAFQGQSPSDGKGMAFLFNDQGQQTHEIVNPCVAEGGNDPLDCLRYDQFGSAVAVLGNTVVVGAMGNPGYTVKDKDGDPSQYPRGKAYLFNVETVGTKETVRMLQKLVPAGGNNGDGTYNDQLCGHRVAVGSSTVLLTCQNSARSYAWSIVNNEQRTVRADVC